MIYKIKQYFKKNSFKALNKEILGYGYEFSFKKYIARLIVILFVICLAGYFLKLKFAFMMITIIYSILAFPIIIRAQFKFMHNNDRFEALTTYCIHMILSFMDKPKILSALDNTTPYVDENIKYMIMKSKDIIQNTTSAGAYKKGLKLIEDDYNCSRLCSMHEFMIDVEKSNSETYKAALSSLYYDINEWITRTYLYQKDLKKKKGLIEILLFFTIAICVGFVSSYEMLDEMVGIFGNVIYQGLTVAFVISAITIYTGAEVKLHGQWIVEDINKYNDEKALMDTKYVMIYTFKKGVKGNILPASLFFIISVICFVFIKNTMIGVLIALVGIYILFSSKFTYDGKKRKIQKTLAKEFPKWLRQVALNLNNYTAVTAMKRTLDDCNVVLKPYIEKLLNDIENNPLSRDPYVEFLSQYHIDDLAVAMNAIYSLRFMSKEETQNQIVEIIKRNQKMLETAEAIENDNSIRMVGMLNTIPITMGVITMAGDLFLVIFLFFASMASKVGG